MMRKLAPFLAIALVAVGLYFALKGGPTGMPKRLTPGRPPVAESRPAQPESQPASPLVLILPTPFVESAPADSRPESGPTSAPYREALVIEVVRDDDRPIAGASLRIRVGDELFLDETADSVGRAEFAAHRGVAATLQVSGENFPVFAQDIALDPGRKRVVVPTGARVAGRVTVFGRPPDEPLYLRLLDDSNLLLWAPTDGGGQFEFFNLSTNWSGHLLAPDAYMVFQPDGSLGAVDNDEGMKLRLDAPNPALDVRLFERLSIKGRLRAPTGESIRGWVDVRRDHGEESDTLRISTDQDGYFRVFVTPEHTHAKLDVADEKLLGTRTIEVSGPFTGVRNLGDIELAAIRTVPFRVRDSAGEPIAGAIGTIDGTWEWSEPTDDAGKSRISVDRRRRDFRVGKLGYTTATVSISEDSTEAIEITLKQGNRLVVDVRFPNGSAPSDNGMLSVRLSSESPMFATHDGGSDEIFRKTGATDASRSEYTGAEHGYSFSTALGGTGRVVIAGFRPGAAMTLEVRGAAIDELVDERFVTIGAEETKTLTIRTPSMPQTFAGRVRTAGGDPIDGALISMRAKEEDHPGEATSGADGRFEADGIFAPAVNVRIWRDGFVGYAELAVPVPPPGAERDFILTPTRDVTITLVNERGRPVLDAAEIEVPWTRKEDSPLHHVVDLGNGFYRVEDIAPGPIVIRVFIGTTLVVTEHDSRIPAVRIVVPTEGAAVVHWNGDVSDAEKRRIRIQSQAGAMFFEGEVAAGTGDHRIDAKLPPGIYWAAIEAWDVEEGTWYAVATSPEFEIVAHQETVVDIL